MRRLRSFDEVSSCEGSGCKTHETGHKCHERVAPAFGERQWGAVCDTICRRRRPFVTVCHCLPPSRWPPNRELSNELQMSNSHATAPRIGLENIMEPRFGSNSIGARPFVRATSTLSIRPTPSPSTSSRRSVAGASSPASLNRRATRRIRTGSSGCASTGPGPRLQRGVISTRRPRSAVEAGPARVFQALAGCIDGADATFCAYPTFSRSNCSVRDRVVLRRVHTTRRFSFFACKA